MITDGCPDSIADNKAIADSDGDGIPDFQDLCPNIPEVYNGFLDGQMVVLIVLVTTIVTLMAFQIM